MPFRGFSCSDRASPSTTAVHGLHRPQPLAQEHVYWAGWSTDRAPAAPTPDLSSPSDRKKPQISAAWPLTGTLPEKETPGKVPSGASSRPH